MKLKNLFYKEELKGKELPSTKESESKKTKEISTSKSISNESINDNDKKWGMLVHLSFLAGFAIPFGNIAAPFLIYFDQKGKSEFIKEQARRATNFQISYTIYSIIFVLIYLLGYNLVFRIAPTFMLIWMFGPFILIFLFNFYWSAKGLQSASQGLIYKYPITIEFIKE